MVRSNFTSHIIGAVRLHIYYTEKYIYFEVDLRLPRFYSDLDLIKKSVNVRMLASNTQNLGSNANRGMKF